MTSRGLMAAYAFLIAAGCAACSGQPEELIVSFEWRSVGGPCRPGDACTDDVTALRSGLVTRALPSPPSSFMLNEADTRELQMFMSDPLLTALRDQRPCLPPIADLRETATVTLSSAVTVSKDVSACRSAPYDAMRSWATRLEGHTP